MKKTGLIILLIGLFIGCEKDKDPTPPNDEAQDNAAMTIKLHAWFNGEALVAGETYHNVSNYRVNVTELRMYLSHIYAVRECGDIVELTDVALFDLTDAEDELILQGVPVDNYAAFGFGIGVSPEMNSPENPDFNIAIYDSNHPLSVFSNMYWTWQSGYRFVIFDGKYDTDPDGTDPLINGYSFHTGKDASYRQVDFDNVSFEVADDGSSIVHLDFDVARFFYSDGDTIDLAVNNQTHGTNQELSDRLSDNIKNAVMFRE